MVRRVRAHSLSVSFSHSNSTPRCCCLCITLHSGTMLFIVLAAVCSIALGDVSHIIEGDHTTHPPPPKPYVFSYTAGRYPGHADRHHAEVSDGSGVVRGTYSYVDPRHKVRTVNYVADKDGFHPELSDPLPDHPRDTAAVAKAKEQHYQLYSQIAQNHADYYNPQPDPPKQSAAVREATARHGALFRVIAEQHARIAAERELLNEHDETLQHLQQ